MALDLEHIAVAQFELMRCLILLLVGKGLVSEKDMKTALNAAGTRLANDPYDEATGRAGIDYINKLVRSLRPDEPPSKAN